MALVRLVWMLTLGLLLGVIFYAAGLLLIVTVVGAPLGIALMVVGRRLQTLRF
jgi:hypothetical protein